MEIIWYGQSAFKLSGKNIGIVMDPFSEPKELGLSPIKTVADIITISHDHWDHNNSLAASGDPKIFDMPGDYEVKGVTFKGVDSVHGNDEAISNTIFTVRIEDLTIAHLGDLGKPLSASQLEKINGVNILLLPVGGNYTLDAEKAVEVVNQIEPQIIIPMHYKTPGSIIDIDPVEKFVKEIGMEPEKLSKLKITKKDLPVEPKLILLETQ